MKQYTYTIVLFLSVQLWAQEAPNNVPDNLSKGHFLIGLSSTNFNIQYILDSDEPGQKGESFFSGDLSALYLTSKNFGVGAFIGYRYNDFLELNHDKRYYLVIGPQLRVYFNSKGKIVPFFEAGAGYLDFLRLDANGFMFNAALGSSFFLNKYVALDAGLNFTHLNTTYNVPPNNNSPTGSVTTNGFGLELGLSLFL